MAKILHIITRLDPGGSTENTIATVQHLAGRRHEVTLASGPHKDLPAELREGLRLKGVRYRVLPHLVRSVSPVHDVICLFLLWRLIRKEKFDLVHTHSSKAGLLGRLAARLSGVKAVVHTPHGHVFYGYFGRIQSAVFLQLERRLARITDVFIALTDQGMREYERYGIHPRKKLVAIPSGVDLSLYGSTNGRSATLKKQLGFPSETNVIGTLGRLDPVKNIGTFLEAAKLLIEQPLSHQHPLAFLVVGDGEQADWAKGWVKNNGLEPWFVFTGSRSDVPELLGVMNVFVSSSLNEGMGRNLVQAQATGLPIVATAVGGVPSVVLDQETGVLVPSQNPKAMAQALAALILSPETAKRYGARGRAWVSETVDGAPRFSAERMLKLIDQIYGELL